MAIAYATYTEIHDALAGALQTTTVSYDQLFRQLAERASRLIDRATGRTFWPSYETRYPRAGGGSSSLRVEDLVEITSIAMSGDDGVTYDYALDSDDYFCIGGERMEYDKTPYARLEMNVNTSGAYGYWYGGQRSVRIVGTWCWHDDWSNAWADAQDTTEDDPLSAAGTSLTVNDANGADLWGATPRFQAGQLLKIEDEQLLVTAVDTESNGLTVLRGRHGTTAAAHDQNTPIYVYRPPELVTQATIIQAVRWFKRGQQGYQDAAMLGDMGGLRYAQKLDPDVEAMLYDAGLRRVTI